MKKSTIKLFLATTALVSTLNAATGAEIFQSNGCAMCHQKNTEGVGPSLQTISMYYATKEDALVAYLQGRGNPIIDPSKASLMNQQLLKLKGLFDEEFRSLARYLINSNMQNQNMNIPNNF